LLLAPWARPHHHAGRRHVRFVAAPDHHSAHSCAMRLAQRGPYRERAVACADDRGEEIRVLTARHRKHGESVHPPSLNETADYRRFVAQRLPDRRTDPRSPIRVTSTTVLRRLLCSATLRIVVNLAGGCVQHDTTWQFPVADPLASATEGKVQELARPFWSGREARLRRWTPACRFRARGGSLVLSAPSKKCPAEAGRGYRETLPTKLSRNRGKRPGGLGC